MSYHSGLNDWTDVTQEIPPQSSGAATVNGAGVDMDGWDGVAYYYEVGAITGAGTLDGYAQNSATSVSANMVNIASAALAQVTNATPNTVQVLDVYRPSLRYMRAVAVVAVNTVVFGVSAIRYRRTGLLPPTHSSNQYVRVQVN